MITRTYYIVYINCDCGSDLYALTSVRWVYGPRCRGCGRILGPIEYRVYGKERASGDLEALRKWRDSRCGQTIDPVEYASLDEEE